MRPVFIPIAIACGLLGLTGCTHRSHVTVSDDGGKSSLTIGDGKLVAESTDEKGKKSSVDIEGSAHISLHDEDGKGLSFDAGKGGISLKAKDEKGLTDLETGKSVSESELGLPFYPGSTEVQAATLSFDSPEKKGIIACRQTDDDPAKVVEYYKPMMKVESSTSNTGIDGENQEIKGKNDAGAEIGIGAKREKGESKTTVTVAVVVTKPK